MKNKSNSNKTLGKLSLDLSSKNNSTGYASLNIILDNRLILSLFPLLVHMQYPLKRIN